MKYSMWSNAVVLTVILLSVLKAQELKMLPEVWGYVRQEEVILPCEFIPGKDGPGLNQVEWTFQNVSEGESLKLVVFNDNAGMHIPDDKYKDKLGMKEYSLVIKNVDLADAGVYTCTLSNFPSGSFTDRTILTVSDQMPLSAGVVAAIVITVTVLLGVIAATIYFIVIRRCPRPPRNHISIDTQNVDRDPSRPSLITREDLRTEVVYAAVELQPANQKRVKTSEDHVTYSQVKVTRKRPDIEAMYPQVMHI